MHKMTTATLGKALRGITVLSFLCLAFFVCAQAFFISTSDENARHLTLGVDYMTYSVVAGGWQGKVAGFVALCISLFGYAVLFRAVWGMSRAIYVFDSITNQVVTAFASLARAIVVMLIATAAAGAVLVFASNAYGNGIGVSLHWSGLFGVATAYLASCSAATIFRQAIEAVNDNRSIV